MICFETVKKYCSGSISNIEGYEKAMSDNTQTWDCHHRLEIFTSDGIKRKVPILKEELIALGCYFNRPCKELIFVTQAEHKKWHQVGRPLSEEHKKRISVLNRLNTKTRCNENMRKKLSEYRKLHPIKAFLGKHHTEESKRLLSENHKGICKGKKWYNNGVEEKMDFCCPHGFTEGRLFHARRKKYEN